MRLEIKDLGLAAYVYMECKDIGKIISTDDDYRNGIIVLEIKKEKNLTEWRMEYLQSDCRIHDSMIMEFRDSVRHARSKK